MEMSDVIPVKDLILGKHIAVMDTFLMLHAHLFIHIIGDEHIDLFFLVLQPAQKTQDLLQRLFVYPVVAVHNLKIFARRCRKTGIYRVSVPAVFLVHHPDNLRIFRLILPCDLQRIILGAIVDNDDLHIFSAGQNALDRVGHVLL